MEIRSVSLRNFKTHAEAAFDFRPGVNAICGENGAGKTSILEAIAWALFDFDSGYRKEDLRRQGESNTSVTVGLVSARDGRYYEVQRRSFKSRPDSYQIYDPELGLKLDNVENIGAARQWLCDHLGFRAGMDLSRLFAEVIGIPQGTFTADFLKTPSDRRRIFDPILGLESYRDAHRQSVDLQRYAEGQQQAIAQQVAILTAEVADLPTLEQQLQQISQSLEQQRSQLQQRQQERQRALTELQQLKQQAQQQQQQQQQLQQLELQRQALEQQQQIQLRSRDEAIAAQQTLEASRDGWQQYQQLTEQIQALNGQLRQREQGRRQLNQLQQQLSQLREAAAGLEQQIASQARWQEQIDQRQPDLQRQEHLEVILRQQQEQQQSLSQLEQRRHWLQQRLKAIATEQQTLQQRLSELQSLATKLTELPRCQAEIEQLQERLARAETLGNLAQDRRAQLETFTTAIAQHQQAVAAAQAQLNDLQAALPLYQANLMQVGKTLEQGLQLLARQLDDQQSFFAQLGGGDRPALSQQLQQQQQTLSQLRQLEKQVDQQGLLEQQLQKLQTEQQALEQERRQISTELQAAPAVIAAIAQAEAELQALGDPRRELQLLRSQLQAGAAVASQLEQNQAQQAQLQPQIQPLQDRLEALAELESQLHQAEQARQLATEDYRRYLQAESVSQQLPEREAQLQRSTEQLAQIQAEWQTLNEAIAAEPALDPGILAAAEQTWQALEGECQRLTGALPGLEQEQQRLQTELSRRQAAAHDLAEQQQQLQQHQAIGQFIETARRIYNQSGPRMSRYFIGEISREGDRLYRELLARPGVALDWTEDYEIRVQEGGRWRPFKTLSGGEQMCAALAVRLALLRVIGQCPIAFFDEPTTNMDLQRRRQMADAIGNLQSFRQLFVISHDDTFEHLTENIVRVERQLV
ncbi:AAA family ATPase [Synechococcus elongatus]|uniref:Nuclease SbcCD subunit C n=1 Tax=Synechococcus elongatus PCC 11802 TaxID=2283154 RepID=A0AAU6R563_SYNEL|nr:SMC family ATPase [Synechococcus elongatus]QFZ92072.1 SMC family ATPase [Synechococcus elongatus PCC 11802]